MAKWREKALAIPDKELCRLAVKGKLSRPTQVVHGPDNTQITRPNDEIHDDWGVDLDLTGILSEATFDYVSVVSLNLHLPDKSDANTVY